MSLFKTLKAIYSFTVWYGDCYSTGENEAIEWLYKQEGIGVKFE